MNATHQRISLWVGFGGILMGAIGFAAFARFLPPPSPELSAAEVVSLYATDTNTKRLGFVMMMLGYGLYFGLSAVLAVQLRRIRGIGHAMSYLQLACGAANALLLLAPSVFFTAAAFRPERSPDATLALHDIGWFLTVMPVSSFMLQQFALAVAVFADRSAQPVFPRWIGYMNVWTATLYLPAYMDTFFKTGPFAWHGLLAFWVPAAAFFVVWLPITTAMLLKAIRQEERLPVLASDGMGAKLAV